MRNALLLVAMLATLTLSGFIRSSSISVEYGYSGLAQGFTLPFSLENGISSSDYFLIRWPQLLHTGTLKTSVPISLLTEDGDILSESYALADSVLTSSQYFVSFGIALTPNTWYQIRLAPQVTPSLLVGFVQLETTSDYLSLNRITYDSTPAFGYYFLSTTSTPSSSLALSLSGTDTTASKIYYLYLDITTSISSSLGNFTVQIYYDNAVHLTGSAGLMDFRFIGDCVPEEACAGCGLPVLQYCEVKEKLTGLDFAVQNVVAGQKIRIKAEVENPIYSSVRGLRVYWVDGVSGIVQERTNVASALTVSPIAITDLGSDRVYFLWGLQAGYFDAFTVGVNVGLFSASTATPLLGPLNSFNLGFKIVDTSPINAQFNVRFKLFAAGMLEGSIVHNLPSTSVATYCTYTAPQLICYNVGSFFDTTMRYFICGKAYYDSSTPSSLANFGDVTIESVVYDDSGNRVPGVVLFTPLVTTNTIMVSQNTEYLDLAGIHSPTKALRYGQVVSFKDDQSRSALDRAIESFTTGNSSTVGIIPNLSGSQQLLFLLNVPQSKMSTLSGNNQYEMKLLYNSKVIGFETGTESMGLDFTGYDSANANWSISYSPCYQTNKVVTQKYNDNFTGTQLINTNQITYDADNNSMYGVFSFKCGQSSLFTSTQASTLCGVNCADECQLFQGYTNTDFANGVMSIRRVTFPSGYHSQLYADQNLLDFVLVFMNGGVVVSTSLINAYTIQAANMVNIKASYVNYYDDTAKSNKGVRIPMMVRIGGAVLANQSRGADTVAVFFDQNTDSSSFQPASSYSIGCSTGTCLYYPNVGVTTPQDVWPAAKNVQFSNLPVLLNEFNLLVPATQKLNTAPSTLTIAFLSSNYSINGVDGLLRVLSVFRLYGPAVLQSITSAIPNINGLAPVASSTLDVDFAVTSWMQPSVASFLYGIDTSLITSSPQNNTIRSGGTAVNMVVGSQQYGGGITFTSFNYNIFGQLYIKAFANTSSCTYFSYLYNEQTAGLNLERTGKLVHTMYCAIDFSIDLSTTSADILFNNPQFPSNFVTGFPLQTVLAYGLSSPTGMLLAYRLETSTISLANTCFTYKMTPYYPNTLGKQRSTFTVSFNQISVGPWPSSYNSFTLSIVIPSTTVPSTTVLTILTTLCDSLNPSFTCLITSVTSLSFNLKFTYTGTSIITLNQISFNMYGISSANFGATGNYTVTVLLPQASGANPRLFGPDYTTQSTLASCQSIFTTSLTGFTSSMIVNNLSLETVSQNVKGTTSFSLLFDYRDAFYSTSSLQIKLGFLQSPLTWRTRGDMFCSIFENSNGVRTISTLWKTMDYSAFPTLTLTPKAQIPTPNTRILNILCTGGAIPNSAQSAQLVGATWLDGGVTVESTATNLTYPTGMLAAATLTPTLVTKRFTNPGMLAFYTFSIVLDTAITSESRIYVEFPYAIANGMNNDRQVECYMRTSDSAATNDVTSTEAFCKLYDKSRVKIYTSLSAASGATLYFDVFNILQPLSTDVTASSFISITLDLDSNFTNGIYKYGQVQQFTPISTAINNIQLISVVATPTLTQSIQNLTIVYSILTNTFSVSRSLYVLLPAGYSVWNVRGATLSVPGTCSVVNTAVPGTELAQSCIYISRRVIKIQVGVDSAGTNFRVWISGVTSPVSVIGEFRDSLELNVFLVADSSEVAVALYSFQKLFSPISLLGSTATTALEWYSNSVSLTQTGQILLVYTGYYSNTFQLRQSTYPALFRETFNITISNYNPLMFRLLPSWNANLGTSSTPFRMAADPALSQPTLYALAFTKTNDTLGLYSLVPALRVVVSSAICSLKAAETSYTIPIGGTTLPIIINASQCIPIDNISITASFSAYSSELKASTDLTNPLLSSQSLDGLYYLVVTHTPGSLPANSSITLSLAISGPQSGYYSAIPSVQLNSTSLNTSTIVPIAILPAIIGGVASTSVTFQMQCTQPSTIYWAVGLTPSVLSMTALDMQARIISAADGLHTNFTEVYDPMFRVYGVRYSALSNALLTQTVSNLKSNSAYQFKYYCMDQIGRVSEGQTINFTSFNSNGYLLRLQIAFNSSITYGQVSDLACSLSNNLIVPYSRIMTSSMSSCYSRSTVFYPELSSTLFEQPDPDNGLYSYGVYVIPDYTIPNDQTNANIKQSLSNATFLTTLLSTTNNSASLPWLISIATYFYSQVSEDISNLQDVYPTMKLIWVQPTTTGVVVNATITNMNGFIVMAMMKGLFYPNMTMPSQVNIKQGLFNPLTTLDAVQMQYVSMNINVTFSINTLLNNTNYTLYYYATVDDPQFSALASAVQAVNVTTEDYWIITVDWAGRVFVGVWIALLAMLS